MATTAEKAELFRRTGALAVDMELGAVRRAMEGSGVPVIGLRAISDPADVAVDPAVLAFVDAKGRTRPVAVAAALVRRPSFVAELRKLGAASKIAAGRLGEAVKWLVEELMEAQS